ncbi:hypothetical protein BDF22DRAFT_524035 [Syncephalis plumigaleata]|nr:hypothetical protein BDF22DRAFT_524035 [Syncephalis plumigaleata]
MSTSTPTEMPSNPNSSCRLLDCLNCLPFHDQCVFRSLLGHIELVRLSACCRSLTSSIRNDKVLWQQLYHSDFLSGPYYAKEMDFVLWCVRTDVNNPCTSDKRADLLENVDWYNTYRRRASTENNWRFGRCKTTHIDTEQDKDGDCYRTGGCNNLVIIQQNCPDGTQSHTYILQHLPHSNLISSNNIVYNSTLSISPNAILLDIGNEIKYFYVTGDHYIAVAPRGISNKPKYNVKILTRRHGDVFTTFDVPVQYQVKTIKGKWVSLEHISHALVNDSLSCKINAMVFDIDNSIMCPGSIDGIWDATHFYKTTNNTAIVYTARLVEVKDDVDRIEWALYQFSSNNPVVQLRNGWFHLPEKIRYTWLKVHNSYDSYIIIRLCDNSNDSLYIMHSVASSGQSHTPRNCYTMTARHIPTPLLRAGCKHLTLSFRSTEVWADLSYNEDQVLQMPGATLIRHVIGYLYIFITYDRNDTISQLLIDINTKEIIRTLETPNTDFNLPDYALAGMLCGLRDMSMQVFHEYGEL